MARYVNSIEITADKEKLFDAVSKYLASEGYKYTVYQNENVFKKGNGLLTAPTFIKLTIAEKAVRLEAWLKFAVLPGVYAGEMDLEGVTGIAVKVPLRKRVKVIEDIIAQHAITPAE